MRMKVSVLMSIYNESENEIVESIHSILSQTYQDFEIVIIHDNPAVTNKQQLIDRIRTMDSRIRVYENEVNIGLAMSMNRAYTYAQGEYIIRMDSDDICKPTRFEKEIHILESQCYDLVFTNYEYIDEMGNVLNNGQRAINMDKDEQVLLHEIVFAGVIHHPTVAMTRRIFEKVGGYRNYPCAQDHDLWLRMIENGCRLFFLDDILLSYRLRRNSISGQNRLKQHETINYINARFIKSIRTGLNEDYTMEKYIKFLDKNTGENERRAFAKANNSLQKALYAKNIAKRYYYRVSAFLVSSAYRRSFLQRLINERLVMKWLSERNVKVGYGDVEL